jgi:hypothetical protein
MPNRVTSQIPVPKAPRAPNPYAQIHDHIPEQPQEPKVVAAWFVMGLLWVLMAFVLYVIWVKVNG